MSNETEKRVDSVGLFKLELDEAVRRVRAGGASEVVISPLAIHGGTQYAGGEAADDKQRAQLLQEASSKYLTERGIDDFKVQVRLQEDIVFADGQEPFRGPTRIKVDLLRKNGRH